MLYPLSWFTESFLSHQFFPHPPRTWPRNCHHSPPPALWKCEEHLAIERSMALGREFIWIWPWGSLMKMMVRFGGGWPFLGGIWRTTASLFEAQRSASQLKKNDEFSILWEAHESPPCLMIKTPNLRPRGNPRGQGVRNKSYCNRRQRMAEDGRGGGGENEVTSDSLRFMKVPLLLTMVSQKKHHSSPAVGCACCDVFHCWGAAKAILPMTVEAKDGRRNVQTWLKCQEMWSVLASKRIARIAELSKIVAESLCVLTGKNANFNHQTLEVTEKKICFTHDKIHMSPIIYEA